MKIRYIVAIVSILSTPVSMAQESATASVEENTVGCRGIGGEERIQVTTDVSTPGALQIGATTTQTQGATYHVELNGSLGNEDRSWTYEMDVADDGRGSLTIPISAEMVVGAEEHREQFLTQFEVVVVQTIGGVEVYRGIAPFVFATFAGETVELMDETRAQRIAPQGLVDSSVVNEDEISGETANLTYLPGAFDADSAD